jgi:hypothetical protein
MALAWGCRHGEHCLLWRSIDNALLGLCLENFRFRLLVLLLQPVFLDSFARLGSTLSVVYFGAFGDTGLSVFGRTDVS